MRGRPDRIFGPKGGAEGSFNNFGIPAVKIELFEGEHTETVEVKQPDLFKEEFQAFVDAIVSGQPAPVSFKQGREMLKLSHAVLESIETGKIVYL